MSSIVRDIEQIGCEVVCNFPMNKYTSLRVGGLADMVVYPNDSSQFVELLGLLSASDLNWVVLGAGSNTIVTDKGIDGVVVVTKRIKNIEISIDGRVIAEPGAVLGTILNLTLKAGLTGFEFAAGIPGTVGGGIFMNAGANGGEIKDVVENVWIWHEGKEILLKRDQIIFEYRKSHLPRGSIVTRASFMLEHGDREASEENVREYMGKRSLTQPIKMSNTGSIFKNPPQIAAGKLLEELGFKGYAIGGAKFSDIHANIIVNSGGASAEDIINLIETAKHEALTKRGISLQTEVRIIGNNN